MNRLRLLPGAESAHFADRAEAGAQLANALQEYRGRHPLVLALPRGGVAVAAPIAAALAGDLDVLVVQKLRVAWQPELAMGAIAEGDVTLWDAEIADNLRIPPDLREVELERARTELARRLDTYRAVRRRVPIAGRSVIIVDDGVATGSTLRAAVRAVAAQNAASIGVALPGGAHETMREIAADPAVHELVALAAPPFFAAVSELYDSFSEMTTEEVCAALRAVDSR